MAVNLEMGAQEANEGNLGAGHPYGYDEKDPPEDSPMEDASKDDKTA